LTINAIGRPHRRISGGFADRELTAVFCGLYNSSCLFAFHPGVHQAVYASRANLGDWPAAAVGRVLGLSMTKLSKVLVVLVTVLAVGQLGVALVSSAARTDWKAKAAEFPRAKTQEWKSEAESFNRRRDDAARQTEEARKFIEIDGKALSARADAWAQSLSQLADQEHALRNQNAAEAVTVQARQDLDSARRAEVERLALQYQELVAQKEAALTEARRLRDLLYQSRGVLERALRRQQLLEQDRDGRRPEQGEEYEPANAKVKPG
jgi:hypothetical protein